MSPSAHPPAHPPTLLLDSSANPTISNTSLTPSRIRLPFSQPFLVSLRHSLCAFRYAISGLLTSKAAWPNGKASDYDEVFTHFELNQEILGSSPNVAVRRRTISQPVSYSLLKNGEKGHVRFNNTSTTCSSNSSSTSSAPLVPSPPPPPPSRNPSRTLSWRSHKKLPSTPPTLPEVNTSSRLSGMSFVLSKRYSTRPQPLVESPAARFTERFSLHQSGGGGGEEEQEGYFAPRARFRPSLSTIPSSSAGGPPPPRPPKSAARRAGNLIRALSGRRAKSTH
ncbi:hypothetical protein JCM8547_001140 [Rhodosporidiobolus lusitaniae]